jgi:single stranded DNA-binding protein
MEIEKKIKQLEKSFKGWENDVTFGGYIGKSPDVKTLPSGVKIIEFSLGRTTKNKAGQENTTWMNVKFWNDMTAAALQKGNNVTVKGRLEQSNWLDKTTGAPRSKIEIIGSSFEKHEKKERAPAPSAAQVEIPFNEFDDKSIPF